MKVLIFVRGIESPLRRQVVSELMKFLNPDLNNVRAIRIGMDDYQSNDKNWKKAADRTCKNLAKKIIGGSHAERFIVIDNENADSQNWLAYLSIGDQLQVNTVGFGINVGLDENLNKDDFAKKLNLLEQKLPVFIATMYKYHEVNMISDLQECFGELEQLRKKE